MENSILKKLAPELRLKIYAHVFEGAEITITIRKAAHGTDQRPDAEFAYSVHARLAQTCQAIRAESLHVLYRKAIIVGAGPRGSNYVWLDDLNKVLDDDLALEVAHVRNIRLPELRNLPHDTRNDAMTLLKKYPKLKTCGLCFAEGETRSCARSFASAEGTLIGESIFKESPDQVYDKSFRFTTASDVAPPRFLEGVFGIRESCQVLFLQLRVLRWDFEYGLLEPELRFAPMDEKSADSHLPSSLVSPMLAIVNWYPNVSAHSS